MATNIHDIRHEEQERNNKMFALIPSSVYIVFAIVSLFIFTCGGVQTPVEPGGVLVALGAPDVGMGDDGPSPGEPGSPEPPMAQEPEEAASEEPEPQKKLVQNRKKRRNLRLLLLRQILKRLFKPKILKRSPLKKEREAAKKRAEDAEKAKQEQAAKDKATAAKKAADEAAKKKAAEDAKNKQGSKFKNPNGTNGGGGTKTGQGNNGTAGSQGDPNGDPNAKNLEGVSGSGGKVGGNLSGRKIAKRGPGIKDNSQKTGTVVLYVCVDGAGNVTSAKYTQSGSNTADADLINLAVRDAKLWKFDKSEFDSQCGTFTYTYKLQ
jgi:hypothetical protein